MSWWKGCDVEVPGKGKLHIETLIDALNDMAEPPQRDTDKPMRLPISGIYKIKGVGDVLAGRVEQGIVEPKKEVVFLPTHTSSNACAGTVFSVEMHHKRVDCANPGDNVGLNIKGLDKLNMPRAGDVMIYKSDNTLGGTQEFTAQIQTMDSVPGSSRLGILQLVSCAAAVRRADSRKSSGKWGRKLVERN